MVEREKIKTLHHTVVMEDSFVYMTAGAAAAAVILVRRRRRRQEQSKQHQIDAWSWQLLNRTSEHGISDFVDYELPGQLNWDELSRIGRYEQGLKRLCFLFEGC